MSWLHAAGVFLVSAGAGAVALEGHLPMPDAAVVGLSIGVLTGILLELLDLA